jgi:hypothetical protein
MFDERSEKCMNIYKGYTKVMFWLYVVAASVLCIVAWCDCIYITDSAFLDGLILLTGGLFVAFTHFVVNMLLIQLLTNVQIIREKIEKM